MATRMMPISTRLFWKTWWFEITLDRPDFAPLRFFFAENLPICTVP